MTLSQLLAQVRRYGLGGSVRKLTHTVRIRTDVMVLRLLQRLFRFQAWHATSPVSARPYRKCLAQIVNDQHPRTVVEVGCGLGAILAGVKAERRYGYDVDANAIRAARFLRGRSIAFATGGFEQVTQEEIEVLIAVNWLHDYSPEQVEHWLKPLLPRTRYLLVDAIEAGTPGYLHYHDFEFVGGATTVVSDSFGEPHRRFLLLKPVC